MSAEPSIKSPTQRSAGWWSRVSRRLLGRASREKRTEEPLYFSRLKTHSDEEWRAALRESPAKAARWVYAAATYGNIDAQLFWAQMLLDGYGTQRDPEGAYRWFRIAAESKRADAMNMLGRCHERGWGVPADPGKAVECYREAAAGSNAWAQFNLGSLLLDGNGVERDPQAARALFAEAAEQNLVKAFYMLGRCLEEAWGGERDTAAAEEWFRRGAEGGDFRAQYRYGLLLFEQGKTDAALSWLHLVADSAPAEFCRQIAGDLIQQRGPLADIGARAHARATASID